MDSGSDSGLVLVTGASGHIGAELCRRLRAEKCAILAIDIRPNDSLGVLAFDLRSKHRIAELLENHRVRTIIHAAGILPTAFNLGPLEGAAVNLEGSLELLRQAVRSRVERFVFASSMSVYGSEATGAVTEDDATAPTDPYGASKRAVELIGDATAKQQGLQFVSLRIARVVGPGIKAASSSWRSEIFQARTGTNVIRLPFAPAAEIALVHVEDVGRMLATLAIAPHIHESAYNSPAEVWKVADLKRMLEDDGGRVVLGDNLGGPTCHGERFTAEFGFRPQGLRERLQSVNEVPSRGST